MNLFTHEQWDAIFFLVMGMVLVLFFAYCSKESWKEVRKSKSQTFTKVGFAVFFEIAALACFLLTSYDAIVLFIRSEMYQNLVWWGCVLSIIFLPVVIGMKKERKRKEAA